VHTHIGREPSGHSFNAITLDSRQRPHNPMINAGAIVSCSLIKSGQSASERFAHVFDTWRRLTAGGDVSFNNTVFLSERDSADRNFALAYFLRENAAFPKNTGISATLDCYFQCCSVEMTCDSMAIAAATLANGGVNPLTDERVFSIDTVKNCLSLMHSCGMYDFSGEFAFLIGVPAKSGVGGGIMVVVPEVLGYCVWAPPLDEHGNSVRGIEFCKSLMSKYSFHNFDIVSGAEGKKRTLRVARYRWGTRVLWTCAGPRPKETRKRSRDSSRLAPRSTALTTTGELRCILRPLRGKQLQCSTSCRTAGTAMQKTDGETPRLTTRSVVGPAGLWNF
jgi:glutaminase